LRKEHGGASWFDKLVQFDSGLMAFSSKVKDPYRQELRSGPEAYEVQTDLLLNAD
jgi:hypothetical protein